MWIINFIAFSEVVWLMLSSFTLLPGITNNTFNVILLQGP